MKARLHPQQGLAHPLLIAFLLLLLILMAIAGFAYLFWGEAMSPSFSAAESPTEESARGGVQEVIRGEYSPPFIPVTLSVDSNGVLQVNASSRLITPAGTFSVAWERQKIFYLEVTLGTETRFYQLGQNKFKIYLPNSLDDTSVRYDGEGNVRILVPDPGEVCFPGSRKPPGKSDDDASE